MYLVFVPYNNYFLVNEDTMICECINENSVIRNLKDKILTQESVIDIMFLN